MALAEDGVALGKITPTLRVENHRLRSRRSGTVSRPPPPGGQKQPDQQKQKEKKEEKM
jgi:hypothetical protein